MRFSDEELKHQELFRRIEGMIGGGMPDGYRSCPQPNEVASVVLGKSTWAVLALTCHIELFTQAHYRESIEPTRRCRRCSRTSFSSTGRRSPSTPILDELEWVREDAQADAGRA